MAYVKTEQSTQHGLITPHGLGVPHRYPQSTPTLTQILIGLTKSLYPTGRAWQMPEFSVFEQFHVALNVSYLRLIDDANFLIESTLPDSTNFAEDDANLWEFRLGLISSVGATLAERRAAILRKLAFPSNIKARQHPFYIQSQIQAAGFDVYVHENTPPYQTPQDILLSVLDDVQHGDPTQHGPSTLHGAGTFSVIANSLDPDEVYSIGPEENLFATFFLSGENINDIATVPLARQREFRELILKLKPAQTVAFTLINYV
jgi:uncharacterized protein YmfQ (DUF2313 family)